MSALPGSPGPRLQAIWDSLAEPERAALLAHLAGATSADFLADLLGRHGHTVSASSIRTYRRSIRQKEV